MATILIFTFTIAVFVFIMNALIAILGDSFDQAQETNKFRCNHMRAQLIVEYINVIEAFRGKAKAEKIGKASRWVHRLEPKFKQARAAALRERSWDRSRVSD